MAKSQNPTDQPVLISTRLVSRPADRGGTSQRMGFLAGSDPTCRARPGCVFCPTVGVEQIRRQALDVIGHLFGMASAVGRCDPGVVHALRNRFMAAVATAVHHVRAEGRI